MSNRYIKRCLTSPRKCKSKPQWDINSHLQERLLSKTRKTAKQWLADLAVTHLHVDKPGGRTGEWDRLCNPGFQCREIKPQNLWLKKPIGVVAAGETPSLTGEFTGKTHRGPRMYTNPPTQESAPERPNLLVGSGGSDWKLSKWHCSLSDPSPSHKPQRSTTGCPALVNT